MQRKCRQLVCLHPLLRTPRMYGVASPAIMDDMRTAAQQLVDRPAVTILVEELPSSLSARDVFARLAGLPHAAFLDSAMSHPTLGRYSFLTADPFEWISSRGRRVVSSRQRQA